MLFLVIRKDYYLVIISRVLFKLVHMFKKWCFVFIFHFISLTIYGQRGYVVKDSSLVSGIFLKGGNEIENSKICKVNYGKKTLTYTPREVKEYGFDDGRVYVAKDIKLGDTIERVFLERLYFGKTSVFYHKTRGERVFFIEKDSNHLIEISKRDKNGISYKSQLTTIMDDCKIISKPMKYVSYKKKQMAKIVSIYDDCELKNFPHFRIGLSLGYGLNKFFPTKNIENEAISSFDFRYIGGGSIRLFIDKPLFLSDFSLHAELYYSGQAFSDNRKIGNSDLDIVVNREALQLPLLLRYTLPTKTIRPFVNIGFTYAHNLRYESNMYSATQSQGQIEIRKLLDYSFIAKDQIGISIGSGIEYKLNFKKSLFFDVRYNHLYGLPDVKSMDNAKYFRNSEINFMVSINF